MNGGSPVISIPHFSAAPQRRLSFQGNSMGSLLVFIPHRKATLLSRDIRSLKG
jgi:hypothetical protein